MLHGGDVELLEAEDEEDGRLDVRDGHGEAPGEVGAGEGGDEVADLRGRRGGAVGAEGRRVGAERRTRGERGLSSLLPQGGCVRRGEWGFRGSAGSPGGRARWWSTRFEA